MKKIRQPKPRENKMDLEQYMRALKEHDWTFEWSEDQNIWRRGIEQRQQLRAAQHALDQDCVIWNSLCPVEYKLGEKKDA